MKTKRILSLLLAVMLMFSIFPSALAAEESAQPDELLRLTWDNVSWNLPEGAEMDVDTSGPLYYKNEDTGRNDWFDAFVEYDGTTDASAEFMFTCPESMIDEDSLAVRYQRYRPGDRIGNTVEPNIIDDDLTDGTLTISINEMDGPWVYDIEFGIMDKGRFIPYTYRYAFRLSIRSLAWMTWADISLSCSGREVELDDMWPYIGEEHAHLFMDENNGRSIYFKKSNLNEAASAVFTITSPVKSPEGSELVAKVNDEIQPLEKRAFQVEVENEESTDLTIQFGVMEDDSFIPLTYEYTIYFEAASYEHLTWDNVECTSDDNSIMRVQYRNAYGTDTELSHRIFSSAAPNWFYVYDNREKDDEDSAVHLIVTPPDNIADGSDIFVQYNCFERGSSHGDGFQEIVIDSVPDTGYSVEIGENDNLIHEFQFGVKNGDGEFIPKTFSYAFGVDVFFANKLDWDNISYEPSTDGIEINENNIIKYSVSDTNEMLPDYKQTGYGVNAYILPVTEAPAGSRMTFQIHCPESWDTKRYHVFVDYVTNIRGAQSNDTATRDWLDLEDGILSIPVDISMAFPVRWHRITFYLQDSDGNLIQQSSRYSFDLIARDDTDTAVNAPVTVEGDKANADVKEGSIQDKIQENPDADRIFIKSSYTDTGFVPSAPEVNVTLGKNDANAVIDGNKTLEIATPLGTIAVPSEAVAQAMGESDEDAASLRLKVQTRESEDIAGSGDINVEIIGVTLHRVVNGEESDAVPVQLSDGKALTVTVITQKQTPVVVVYLPKNGGPIFHAQVNNVNDRVSFSTSHLSEFALLSYDEARKLGLVGTSSIGSGSSGGASHVTRQPGYTASGDKDTDKSSKAGRIRVDSVSNGSVEVSPRSPSRGDRVTLTVTPDAGYQLDNIEVLDEKDKPLRLDNPAENVYTFTMPSGDVTVSAQFVSDGTAPASAPAAEENTARSASFADVKTTDWYSASVAFVTENGMMAGNNGYFSPNSSLTRAMIAQILYNMENASAAGSARFPDVYASDWFSDSVTWAVSQGYMNGYGSGSFGPNDAITREQLAAVFYSYSQRKGYDVSASGAITSFTDSAAVSDWSEVSVRWAVGAGLISGKSGGRLDPSGTASRAEVAQILMNFRQNIAR